MQSCVTAECHGDEVEPGDLNRPLWDLLAQSAQRHPHHEAVVSLWQRDFLETTSENALEGPEAYPPTLRWTYEHLLHYSEALASWLEAQGCASGAPLVAILGNCAEWALFFWAAVKLGVPFVPLDPRGLADIKGVIAVLDTIQPAVIVVSNGSAMESLENEHAVACEEADVLITLSDNPKYDWKALPDVSSLYKNDLSASIPETQRSTNVAFEDGTNHLGDASLIIFTSGTTASPKGCVHTAANLWSQITDWDPQPSDIVDRWLVHTPVAHIFAINNALRAWRRGDAVIFASEFFDVQATLHALVAERITFMSAVPTLVKALLSQPSFPGVGALGLSYVTIGGTTISDEDIRLCKNDFGARDVVQGFGLSEGSPLVSWSRADPLLNDGYHAGVGKVLTGSKIRVCAPGSRDVLNRNEVGELHIGGTSVIKGYLGGRSPESFYTDVEGHCSWHITGDQVFIDEDDVLHVLGRYKDLIIRAGENIAPLKIENALNKMDGVSAQVVGVPDETAGEVPVAIIRGPTKSQISQVAASLGPSYTLDGVYTLDELDLEAYPITTTGKVKKDQLRKAVLRQRQERDLPRPCGMSATKETLPIIPLVPTETKPETSAGLVSELSSIVEDIVGSLPSSNTDVRTFLDSVSILRYCDRVRRQMGRRLYFSDIIEHPTLPEQAKFLLTRGNTPMENRQDRSAKSKNSAWSVLGDSSSSTMNGLGSVISSSRTAAMGTVLSPELNAPVFASLQFLGLEPSNIEAIYPVRANYNRFASGQRPQTYRHRVCFKVEGASAEQIEKALELALATRPILRTLLVPGPSSNSQHICVSGNTLLPHIIKKVEVADEAALERLKQDDSAAAFPPWVTTQACIVTVKDSGRIRLTMTYSHTVFDVLSIEPFHRDLEEFISNPSSLIAAHLTPFSFFTDLYHGYANSEAAKASVNAVAHRLRGISKLESALWPPQRAPGWMIGSDLCSEPEIMASRSVARDKMWAQSGQPWSEQTAQAFRYPRVARVVNLSGMKTLRVERGIEPQSVAMAALAIFNAIQTGQPYAIYNTIEASRSWPFIPPWLENLMPPPMTIDGPTAEGVLHLIRVEFERVTARDSARSGVGTRGTEETVGEFIERVAHEREAGVQHSHAPWDKVLEALGMEESRAAVDATYRQTFVWDVTLSVLFGNTANDYVFLKPEERFDWADCGLYWNCCMADKDNLIMMASWDTAQLTDADVQRYCDGYAQVLRQITDSSAWYRELYQVVL